MTSLGGLSIIYILGGNTDTVTGMYILYILYKYINLYHIICLLSSFMNSVNSQFYRVLA